jgi:hypothetical protein
MVHTSKAWVVVLLLSACGAGLEAGLPVTVEPSAPPTPGEKSVRKVAPRENFFTSPATQKLEKSVRYVHSLAATPADCDTLMASGINCDQVVEFCANGDAWLLVTDIVNKGTFTYLDGAAQVRFPVAGKEPEVPEVLMFSVATDESMLTDGWLRQDWELDATRSWSMCD